MILIIFKNLNKILECIMKIELVKYIFGSIWNKHTKTSIFQIMEITKINLNFNK